MPFVRHYRRITLVLAKLSIVNNMLIKLNIILLVFFIVWVSACSDPRNHSAPYGDFYQVGVYGHGRGVLGDIRLNYFGLERRCDTCHSTDVKKHGDLGTCNRCHQPQYVGWENTLYSREHAKVLSFENKPYHSKLSCIECHQDRSNEASFKEVSCNHCHNHGRSDIEYAHDLLDNYQYKSFSPSNACVSCHSKQGKNYSLYYDKSTGELL